MSDIVYIDSYVNQVLQKIYNNQNLCKYLYYDTPNPLSYPDITDTNVLYDDIENKRIYDVPFNIDIVSSQKTTMTINFYEANLDNNSVFYKDMKLKFFIIAPYSLWNLSASSGESKTRISAIVHELLELFNRKPTVGIGSNYFTKMSNIFPNQQIGGVVLELYGKDFIVNH